MPTERSVWKKRRWWPTPSGSCDQSTLLGFRNSYRLVASRCHHARGFAASPIHELTSCGPNERDFPWSMSPSKEIGPVGDGVMAGSVLRANNGPNGDGEVVVRGMVGRWVVVSTSGRATGGKSGNGGSSSFRVIGAVAVCGCALAGKVGRTAECVKHGETDDNGANGRLKKVVIRAMETPSTDQRARLGG